jgi:rod shape-determining protein MreC
MSLPRGRWPNVAVQLRSLIDRFALGLLVGLSVLLLLLAKADVKLANLAVEQLSDAAVPILQALNQPITALRSGFDRVGAVLAVYDENARLREENRRLLSWQAEAAKLTVQNRALRRMLAVPATDQPPSWTTARVVADSGGVFVHTLLLDAGTDQGVAVGMAAMTPEGLAGRIIDVGRRSSRVLLITDFNSRIPVVIERSGDQAILEGDNTAQPKVRFLPLGASLQAGDRVLTSGRGGMLPPGLMVGQIAGVGDGTAEVRPYVDWSRLDYLSLLHYVPTPPPEGDGASAARAR